MKITNLNSASVLIEANGIKILTDPWLVDGEHYGSWAIYPPRRFEPNYFETVDYIYISHIHHDHCSLKTLEQLNRTIPVVIHRYETQFMKMNLERLGFKVVELMHNQRTELKNGVFINIIAADNCNPELCHRYYGCGIVEVNYGSTQIDTMAVVDNGKFVCVNTNDCPFELSKTCIELIKKQYQNVDFLLTGYLGAGPYPQCFEMLNNDEKIEAAEKKQTQFLEYGKQYIAAFDPRFYMPFAGTYVLAGKLTPLNAYRGNPELEEAKNYFNSIFEQSKNTCVLINPYDFFDLETQTLSKPYQKIDYTLKNKYINEILSQRKMDYETDTMPVLDDFLPLLTSAFERMNTKRQFIKLDTETLVFVYLTDHKAAQLSMNGKGFSVVDDKEIANQPHYVSYKVDPRLLIKILKGPRFSHWNNAEGGSHITFSRHPKYIHERPIYYVMNFFHA